MFSLYISDRCRLVKREKECELFVKFRLFASENHYIVSIVQIGQKED